jgi:PPOX class probable F420-dependent enzyme
MELVTALDYVRSRRHGVLSTLRKDGRPQQSNIMFLLGDDDVIRISITADRAKYANLVREPWAALHVTQDDFWAYVVIEGDVSLSAIAAAPDDAAAEELVAVYRGMVGEHEDWAAYRQAMVDDRRVVVRIAPQRVYGMLNT